jgi:glycosyltransferase involved in cell wall biosynthesis
MRILVTNWTRRRVGGTETYLGRIMSLIADRGHEIGFAYETDAPADRIEIVLPAGATVFAMDQGRRDVLDRIRSWKPDVIYAHGMLDTAMEEQLLEIAPSVFFAHAYYGTCISGEKTHKFPVIQPCDRLFGPACLALFYPRRCGGLSPVTMMREFSRQRDRLAVLQRYDAVLTHSEHMRREFLRHGAARGRVLNCSYTVSGADKAAVVPALREAHSPATPWHLMFIGRMDRLKGGRYLLDALPAVHAATGSALRLTFAGDGPARAEWESHASRMAQHTPAVRIEFTGWLQHSALVAALDTVDVVVMPSLWPEPYGLVGPEANRRGIPVVAFATGGIPEWLFEGVNGCVAPGDPPTVEGLGEAIVRCLRSLATDDTLRQGALSIGSSLADDVHVDALLELLTDVSAHPRRSVPA